MHPKDPDGMANSVDPDQTASSEAVKPVLRGPLGKDKYWLLKTGDP